MDVKYVYTLSSRKGMVTNAVHSIRTLTQWTDPSDIIVYYTPPRNDKDQQILADLGVDIRLADNSTESFAIMPGDSPSHYAEKIRLCDIESETVVFLDCDTLVLDDPRNTLDGDFDFKARPSANWKDTPEWKKLFKSLGQTNAHWMPNAGFLIFKNTSHQEIKQEWIEYYKSDIESLHDGIYLKEQIALSLAVNGLNTKKMEPKEHVFEWEKESPADGIVYHLDTSAERVLSLDEAVQNPIQSAKQILNWKRSW